MKAKSSKDAQDASKAALNSMTEALQAYGIARTQLLERLQMLREQVSRTLSSIDTESVSAAVEVIRETLRVAKSGQLWLVLSTRSVGARAAWKERERVPLAYNAYGQLQMLDGLHFPLTQSDDAEPKIRRYAVKVMRDYHGGRFGQVSHTFRIKQNTVRQKEIVVKISVEETRP
jgi:hypothetical protein